MVPATGFPITDHADANDEYDETTYKNNDLLSCSDDLSYRIICSLFVSPVQ